MGNFIVLLNSINKILHWRFLCFASRLNVLRQLYFCGIFFFADRGKKAKNRKKKKRKQKKLESQKIVSHDSNYIIYT